MQEKQDFNIYNGSGNFQESKQKYIVFMCPKCKMAIYAKTTQKSKKCPRCKRSTKIESNLIKTQKNLDGKIVNGCTAAQKLTLSIQNSFITPKDLGFHSDKDPIGFKSINIGKILHNKEPIDNVGRESYFHKFRQEILAFQIREKIGERQGFPEYIFDFIWDDFVIKLNGKLEIKKNDVLNRLDKDKKMIQPQPGYFYLKE